MNASMSNTHREATPRIGRDTRDVKQYLTPSQVVELAELLEEEPVRTALIDEVLEAAAAGRGMTLRLEDGWGPGSVTLRRSCG